MESWEFLSSLFDTIQTDSPLLGQLWLKIILVFRILILATVATDLFEDEQEQFECNTAQPGCKQVCYDQAFPISQYRFWVFHIVLISTPTVLFYIYSMHLRSKAKKQRQVAYLQLIHTTAWSCDGGDEATDSGSSPGTCSDVEDLNVKRLYMLNVGFRILAEVAFLVAQWALYGFIVAAQYPCSRFPCPYTVDCFTSRPMEKTIFLCFYFGMGLLSTIFSLAEFVHVFTKWRRLRKNRRPGEDEKMFAGEEDRLTKWPGGGGGEERPGRRGLPRSGSRGGGGSGGTTSSRGSWKGRESLDRSTSSRDSGNGRESLDRNTSSRDCSTSRSVKSSRGNSQKREAESKIKPLHL